MGSCSKIPILVRTEIISSSPATTAIHGDTISSSVFKREVYVPPEQPVSIMTSKRGTIFFITILKVVEWLIKNYDSKIAYNLFTEK